MDFLDPQKKRSHRNRLYIGYALIVMIISIVSVWLVFVAYGYNLNFQTGVITQNGLVFVDAHPVAADIYINGKYKDKTDQRLILPSDYYDLELKSSGYRTWQQKFTLAGGKIERFVYPFLFPEKLESNETQLYAAPPSLVTQSPDRRWLIVNHVQSPLSFILTDLSSEATTAAPISVPLSLFNRAGNKHIIEATEWSTDNRHVVVKHTFDTGAEFVMIDIETPASSRNLSRIFAGITFTDVFLRDKRFDRYYLHNQETQEVYAAELDNGALNLLLRDVFKLKSHGEDVILYVTKAGAAEGRALVRIFEDGENYTLRDLPDDPVYLLDIARFENRWYIVAGAVKEKKIYVLRDPVKVLQRSATPKLVPAAILRLDNAENVSFSTNARFIASQAGSRFAVYDAETDEIHRYDTTLDLLPGIKANWMDGHRMTLISKEKVEVFDFDGTNRQTLSPSYSNTAPYFDRDYKWLYTLTNSSVNGRAALLRTDLTVKPQE